eukprot:Skav208978  [mRNA]  locus=scaffold1039:72727:77850:+ [translate_table: standard]
MLEVKGETVKIGKPRDFPTYGWDNEYGDRRVEESLSDVGFREFWQFVAAGGYRTQKYWRSEDGWKWRKFRNMKWPFFWVQDGPQGSMQFKLRTIFEANEIDMEWSWPVDVNYHEARQPLEASQSPVDAMAASPTGHHDAMGNAWEWTEDHFNPLEGFEVHYASGPEGLNTSPPVRMTLLLDSDNAKCACVVVLFFFATSFCRNLRGNLVHLKKTTETYDDFSTPCFDGRHHMIMGGSFMSDSASISEMTCRRNALETIHSHGELQCAACALSLCFC